MARSRMIKPEFFDDEKLSDCSVSARLLFIALWVNSDDYGTVKGNSKWLRAQAFPYDDITSKNVGQWLNELKRIRCIIPFEHSGEQFYFIRNWEKYQKVNRPSQQRNPVPPDNILEGSLNTHGALITETETETETKTETETEFYSSEPSEMTSELPVPVKSLNPVLKIPLIKKDGAFSIFQDDIDQWQDTFPAVNVMDALKRIRQWNHDNPTKRKTKGGVRKHISSWLAREQDKGGVKPVNGQGNGDRMTRSERNAMACNDFVNEMIQECEGHE